MFLLTSGVLVVTLVVAWMLADLPAPQHLWRAARSVEPQVSLPNRLAEAVHAHRLRRDIAHSEHLDRLEHDSAYSRRQDRLMMLIIVGLVAAFIALDQVGFLR